jgi:methyltransferase (TIGR00027 family)
MEPGQPSRTALAAASHRAAHQVLEHGAIFTDPLALRILGGHAEKALRDAQTDTSFQRLRVFVAVCARLAEEALAAAIARGVGQVVVLGAGLDTYAYRTPVANTLRLFEVDRPQTQAWKRYCLAETGIAVPATLTFVPVDFETQTLAACLLAGGFDPTRRTFFSWLAVVPYLTERAVFATLESIVRLPGGAEVVFDYFNPPDHSLEQDDYAALLAKLAARSAAHGEALKTQFESFALQVRLSDMGFRDFDDTGPASIRQRFFPEREPATSDRGGHIVRAAT